MDWTKLTPAPWSSVGPCDWPITGRFVLAHEMTTVGQILGETDCDFAALARNFADVQSRRGWSILCGNGGWLLVGHGIVALPIEFQRAKSFTEAWENAVAADRWLSACESAAFTSPPASP